MDAREPGRGTSTEGLGLVAGSSEPYSRTVDRLGRQRARALEAFCGSSQETLLQDIVSDRGQQVSLTGGGILHAASSAQGAEELERSGALLSQDGFACRWLERQTVIEGVAGEGLMGGLLQPRECAVHPVQLLELLLARCLDEGVQVRARHRVFDVAVETSGVVVRSEEATFRAEQVVLCLGGQTPLLESALVDHLRPRLGQLLATVPLPEPVVPWSLVVDEGAVQAQQLPDGELVAACWRDPTRRGPWEAICRYLGRLCDERVSHEWLWRVSEPADGLPVVGAMPGRERVKYLVGCVDGGVTLGFGAAQELARWVVEGIPPEAFGVGRFSPTS